jgi:hypothetical protein
MVVRVEGLADELLRQSGQSGPPYSSRLVAELLGVRVSVRDFTGPWRAWTAPGLITVQRGLDPESIAFAIGHGCGHVALECRPRPAACRPGRMDHNGEGAADHLAAAIAMPLADVSPVVHATVETLAGLFAVPLWVARRRRLQCLAHLDGLDLG